MYRAHEPPSREKLVALKDYLETFDVAFALGQVIKPATFNRILEKIGDSDIRPQVMEQRSEEHTSELQSLMRISYAVFCLKKKKRRSCKQQRITIHNRTQK